jgi:hypothetical protein
MCFTSLIMQLGTQQGMRHHLVGVTSYLDTAAEIYISRAILLLKQIVLRDPVTTIGLRFRVRQDSYFKTYIRR